ALYGVRVLRRILIITLLSVIVTGCANTQKAVKNSSCSDVQSCAEKIMLRVREQSKLLCEKMPIDKTIVVKSTFSKSGEVLDMELTTSSGVQEFDEVAFNAIKTSAPLFELTMLNDEDFKKASVINFRFEGLKKTE
ncbi:TonB C-terminal domain-containing protein, partial [Thalassotalea sp. SU-HH00458]|uniref:TonB C-terminal domain-containing protein n=1 Tax=Thalassotalea sp. SU-HH00458 TaxID=3127657 RepID=UPI0033657153